MLPKELLSWVRHLTSAMFFAVCPYSHLPAWWNLPTVQALSIQACQSTLLPRRWHCPRPTDVRDPRCQDSRSHFATGLWASVCQGLWKRTSPSGKPLSNPKPIQGTRERTVATPSLSPRLQPWSPQSSPGRPKCHCPQPHISITTWLPHRSLKINEGRGSHHSHPLRISYS